MRADTTAIVMSRTPYRRDLGGLRLLNHVSSIDSHEQMYATRLATLARVRTPWCFWLDDDDELPPDVADVLDECIECMLTKGVPLAYTQEWVKVVDATLVAREFVRPALPYDHARHLHNPLFVHHLALMNTELAQAAAARLPPAGDYWAEHALYATLGRQGAVAVPRVGYIWHNHPHGMHQRQGMARAQLNTQLLLASYAKDSP